MSARNPEDVGTLFMRALNAGDVEALMKLYDPQAVLRPSPGQNVQEAGAIRQTLMGFLAMKPTMSLEVKTLAQCDDIALTTANWKLQGTDNEGKPMQMTGQSVEVCRRQPDGTWSYLIDSPWGLEWPA